MASDPLPIDRGGLEVLTYQECLDLLDGAPVGRFAFIDEGEPRVFPVNHRLSGSSIVFRTTFGAKLHAAAVEKPASFEVDEFDAETRTGWSVIATGTAEQVLDDDEIAELEELDLEPWANAADRDRWVRLRPNEVTGRRIVPPDPEA
ncbi:MAG TPA: pyridoxamine 5'-phosphate oxidase family protein [Nitriliruptorales bacterium]